MSRLQRWRRACVAIVLAAVLSAVAGCAPVRDDGQAHIRLAAIGDSITAYTNQYGARTPWSWMRTAATGNIVDAGGYREWGDDTGQLLAGTKPVSADVIVVMAGTNDIGFGPPRVPTAQTLRNITAIFEKAGVRTRILSALAPKDATGATPTLALNRQLRALAERSGWTFDDPWTAVRAPDGSWVAGASEDGVHPTAHSGHLAGLALRRVAESVAR